MEQRNHDALLVTLADRNFIDQAKQLFSSVYWNAGWKGDYMLLSHEIPEKDLKWFRDKGILVKKCKPLYKKNAGNYFCSIWREYTPTIMDALYLFKDYFSKWDNIVFLEADVIVRSSINKLAKVKGFWARDILFSNATISNQFADNVTQKDIGEEYYFKRPTFNPGVMAFSTDIIREDTFNRLKKLSNKYRDINSGDEGILNLHFYEQWKRLSTVYNIWPPAIIKTCGINPNKIRGIILHFAQESGTNNSRPWYEGNPFYQEWRDNLDKSELIDLDHRPRGRKSSVITIYFYPKYLYLKKYINFFFRGSNPNIMKYKDIIYSNFTRQVDLTNSFIGLKNFIIYQVITHLKAIPPRIAGIIGQTIKKISPQLYYKLKGKNGKRKTKKKP